MSSFTNSKVFLQCNAEYMCRIMRYWIKTYLVLEEKYLFLYKSEHDLEPVLSLHIESIHTHIMTREESLTEMGREFLLLLSTARITLVLTFRNEELCDTWGTRLQMLHVLAQSTLLGEAQKLLLKHTVDGVTSPIQLENYVDFRDNYDHKKMGS